MNLKLFVIVVQFRRNVVAGGAYMLHAVQCACSAMCMQFNVCIHAVQCTVHRNMQYNVTCTRLYWNDTVRGICQIRPAHLVTLIPYLPDGLFTA